MGVTAETARGAAPLTLVEAAEEAGLAYMTAWQLVRQGRVPVTRERPRGPYRLPAEAVESLRVEARQRRERDPVPDEVRARIVRLRSEGLSYHGIADALNRERTPTARGRGSWYSHSVRRVNLETTQRGSG